MRLLNAVKMDVQFQFRQGFYYAYLLVSIVYIILLLLLPERIVATTLVAIIFTDPAVLGAFFIGGLILLERRQSIFNTLFVTPLNLHEYLLAKLISLTFLAVIVSTIIINIISNDKIYHLPFIIGVAMISVFFTLLGIIIAFRVESVNAFLFTSPLYVTVFFLPLLKYFQLYETRLFILLPSEAGLLLLQGGLISLTFVNYLYAIITLLIWISIFYFLAYNELKKYIKYKCF